MPTHVFVHKANQCANNSYQKAGIIQEHHVYKATWISEVGEELLVHRDSNNKNDKHTIAVMKVGKIFGCLPRTIRMFHFSLSSYQLVQSL